MSTDSAVDNAAELRDPALQPSPSASSAASHMTTQNRDLDFIQAIRILWKMKWLIIVVIFLCIGAGITYVVTFTPVYVARMIVSPSVEGLTAIGGQSSIGSRIGSLSSVFGSENVNPNFENLTVLISTKTLAKILQEKHRVLQFFFKGSWDQTTNTWLRPTGDYFEFKEQVKLFIGYPTWTPPTEEAISSYIADNIIIRPILETKIKEIIYEHSDRDFAKNFLAWVIFEADNAIRNDEIQSVQSKIKYLEDQFERTTVNAHRIALTRMMVAQQETAMLLHSGPAFSFTLLESATVSDKPTRPPVMRVGLLSVAAGIVISSVLALLIHGLRIAFQR